MDSNRRSDDDEIPPPPCTNLPYFLGFVTFVIVFILFSAAFLLNNNVNKFIHGYDIDENICGLKNEPISSIDYSGQDMTAKPIALYRYQPEKQCPYSARKVLPFICVNACDPPHELIFHRCYPEAKGIQLNAASRNLKLLHQFFHALDISLYTILAMLSFGLSLVFAIFLWMSCQNLMITFWIGAALQAGVSVAIVIVAWKEYMGEGVLSLIYALACVAFTLYLVFLIIFIIVFYDTFPLLEKMYKNALEALFNLPLFCVYLLIAYALVALMVCYSVYATMAVFSSTCFQRMAYNFPLRQNPQILNIIFALYMFFAVVWSINFIEGWLTMVIAGAVSKYYLARDKSALQQPLRRSYQTLMRYHLGTLACGSCIVTLLSLIRNLAEYATRKVYIQTAVYGHAFCTSASKAMKLLSINLAYTVAITGFGFIFIYGLACFVFIVTMGTGIWMNLNRLDNQYMRFGICLGAFLATLMALFALNVINTAADTVFFHFCEDQVRTNVLHIPDLKAAKVARGIKTFKTFFSKK